jgi:hypothetical protein
VSFNASTKIIQHARQHAHTHVMGVVVGSCNDHTLRITDAIALFHCAILSPMLEMALSVADEFVASRSQSGEYGASRQSIIGVYYAPEFSQSLAGPSALISSIMDQIRSLEPNAQLLMVRSVRELCLPADWKATTTNA